MHKNRQIFIEFYYYLPFSLDTHWVPTGYHKEKKVKKKTTQGISKNKML